MFIVGDTLDDLLHRSFGRILKQGAWVNATRGRNKELCCVLLKLSNPLARLSHTENRGRVFSALGELAWYLAGQDDGEFVAYYIDRYKHEVEGDGTIHGAYGPRMFTGSSPQYSSVIQRLRENPTTRKAIVQLFDADDLRGNFKDVPCTCSLQFMVRADRLHMSVVMRSNDAYFGLPHDVFSFTMLQELTARTLGCELGTYSHYVGSFHIYEDYHSAARQYIDEGWQDEYAAMPKMPRGDPWPSVQAWLEAEKAIRAGLQPAEQLLNGLDDYWCDLVRLLQVFTYVKTKKLRQIVRIKGEMKSHVYKEYIAQKAKPRQTLPRSGQGVLFPMGNTDDGSEST